MTSWTRKLYNRDPAAAERFFEQQRFMPRFERSTYPSVNDRLYGGVAAFTPATKRTAVPFGKRQRSPSAGVACDQNCGHPACSQGCVLWQNRS